MSVKSKNKKKNSPKVEVKKSKTKVKEIGEKVKAEEVKEETKDKKRVESENNENNNFNDNLTQEMILRSLSRSSPVLEQKESIEVIHDLEEGLSKINVQRQNPRESENIDYSSGGSNNELYSANTPDDGRRSSRQGGRNQSYVERAPDYQTKTEENKGGRRGDFRLGEMDEEKKESLFNEMREFGGEENEKDYQYT